MKRGAASVETLRFSPPPLRLLQEARVSRAVELMLAHVENLRRQHHKNVADLEEAKKLIQQQSLASPGACSGG